MPLRGADTERLDKQPVQDPLSQEYSPAFWCKVCYMLMTVFILFIADSEKYTNTVKSDKK